MNQEEKSHIERLLDAQSFEEVLAYINVSDEGERRLRFSYALNYADGQKYMGALKFFLKEALKGDDFFAVTADYQDKLSVFYELGFEYYRLKNYDMAVRCYKAAIAKHPESMEAYYDLGMLSTHLKKFVDAQQCFQKALEISPGNELILIGRAHWSFLQKLFFLASDDLRKAVRIYLSKNSDLEAMEKAKRYFATAIRMSPRHTECIDIAEEVSRKSPADALDFFFMIEKHTCFRCKKQIVEIFLRQAEDFVQKENLEAAKECLEKALCHQPNNTTCLRRLGDIFWRQGDLKIAQEIYAELLGTEHQSNPETIRDFARVSMELKEYSDVESLCFNIQRISDPEIADEIRVLVVTSGINLIQHVYFSLNEPELALVYLNHVRKVISDKFFSLPNHRFGASEEDLLKEAEQFCRMQHPEEDFERQIRGSLDECLRQYLEKNYEAALNHIGRVRVILKHHIDRRMAPPQAALASWPRMLHANVPKLPVVEGVPFIVGRQ